MASREKKYWWVNQNQTFRHEKKLKCLWAPYLNKLNRKEFYWETMDELNVNDIVFSYLRGKIVSYNLVKKTAYRSRRPKEFRNPNQPWKYDGRRVDAIYNMLDEPIEVGKFAKKLKPFLPEIYSPYNIKTLGGNEGYLYAIGPEVAEIFFQEIKNKTDLNLDENIAISEERDIDDNSTGGYKTAQTKVRVGHNKFVKRVKNIWRNKCCITGIKEQGLLTASHIKPWRYSDKKEKVDSNNGLLLSPSYNATFDKNYISFSDNGKLLISNIIKANELKKIGINVNVGINGLTKKHKKYLTFHRDNLGHKYK